MGCSKAKELEFPPTNYPLAGPQQTLHHHLSGGNDKTYTYIWFAPEVTGISIRWIDLRERERERERGGGGGGGNGTITTSVESLQIHDNSPCMYTLSLWFRDLLSAKCMSHTAQIMQSH